MKHKDKNNRPKSLPVDATVIPQELKDHRNWILWHFEWRDDKEGEGAWSKVPYQANGQHASSTNSETWSAFETVWLIYKQTTSRYDGLGFVFSSELPYVGIDLDECVTIDDDQFHLTPFSAEVVERLATYTEISPSLTGLHCIGKGEWERGRKIVQGTDVIEIYKAGRYFTFTGVSWQENPLEIQGVTDDLTAIVKRMDVPKAEYAQTTLDVDARITMALKNPKIETLFYGNIVAYGGDDSKADMALVSLLTPYCEGNRDILDAMFRRSKLMRHKWDERRGHDTYGNITMDKAIANHASYLSTKNKRVVKENTAENRRTRRFSFDDLWEAAMEFRQTPDSAGVTTGWNSLDAFYRPARGMLSIVTGIPSHGKSTFVDVLAYNLMKQHQWHFTFASFETRPIQRHILNLCQIHLARPTYSFVPGAATNEEMEQARAEIGKFFRFVKPDDTERKMEAILDFVDDDIREFGIDGFVLDPFTELDQTRPGNMLQTEYIETILRRLQTFTSVRDIHSWLIAHPTKAGETYRNGRPTLASINGSAHFYNKADYGLVVFRTPENETQVIVEKVRNDITGTTGEVAFRFDRAARRYIEIFRNAPEYEVYGR